MGIMGSLVWIVIGAIVLLRMLIRDWSGVTGKEDGAKQRELDMWVMIGFFVIAFIIIGGILWMASELDAGAEYLVGAMILGIVAVVCIYYQIKGYMKREADARARQERLARELEEKRMAELAAKQNASEEYVK